MNADVTTRLKTALRRMVEEFDETRADSGGRYPAYDEGCPDCTSFTVPDRDATGRCAYHAAKELLGDI